LLVLGVRSGRRVRVAVAAAVGAMPPPEWSDLQRRMGLLSAGLSAAGSPAVLRLLLLGTAVRVTAVLDFILCLSPST
jgi:hypothetical protein